MNEGSQIILSNLLFMDEKLSIKIQEFTSTILGNYASILIYNTFKGFILTAIFCFIFYVPISLKISLLQNFNPGRIKGDAF